VIFPRSFTAMVMQEKLLWILLWSILL